MRGFVVFCLVAVVAGEKLGYNYQPVSKVAVNFGNPGISSANAGIGGRLTTNGVGLVSGGGFGGVTRYASRVGGGFVSGNTGFSNGLANGIGGGFVSGGISAGNTGFVSGVGNGIGGGLVSGSGIANSGFSSGIGSGIGGGLVSGSVIGGGISGFSNGIGSGIGGGLVSGSGIANSGFSNGIGSGIGGGLVSGSGIGGGNSGFSNGGFISGPVNGGVYSAPLVTEYNKEFYFHSAPEEEFNDGGAAQRISSTLKKNLRVVFIKAPENNALTNAALQIAKQATEDRTAIYVLTKENDISQISQQLQQIQQNKAQKPEVRFVKYRTPEDAINAQRAIQAQYDALGGSSKIVNEGTAPVLNYASASPIQSYSGEPTQYSSSGPISTGSIAAPSVSYNQPKSSYLPPVAF